METGRKDTTRFMTEFVFEERAGGKTFKAVDKVLQLAQQNKDEVVLVVLSAQERQRLFNLYPDLWKAVQEKRVRVETPFNMGQHERGRGSARYVVDNADIILAMLLNTRGPIELVTWTS